MIRRRAHALLLLTVVVSLGVALRVADASALNLTTPTSILGSCCIDPLTATTGDTYGWKFFTYA